MSHIRNQKNVVVLTVLIGVCSLLGVHSAQADSAKTSIEPLLNLMSGAEVPGTGTILVRTKDGVGATLHTSGLTPGHVYTLWFTVFNNPKRCATTPCSVPGDLMNPNVRGVVLSGTGQIAGDDGTADFGAFRAVGDTTGVFEGIGTGEGLLNAKKAEIHLVVRTHGPVIPAMLEEQLTTFNGGCPPNTCVNVQAAPYLP
jgi:hypothetical protein